MCFSLNIVDQRIHISSNKWVVSVEHLIKQAPWTPNVTLWTVLFFLKELWGGINWSAFDGHSSLLIHVAFNETSKTKITKLYLAFPKNNFTLFIIAMNGWTDGKIIICFSKIKRIAYFNWIEKFALFFFENNWKKQKINLNPLLIKKSPLF